VRQRTAQTPARRPFRASGHSLPHPFSPSVPSVSASPDQSAVPQRNRLGGGRVIQLSVLTPRTPHSFVAASVFSPRRGAFACSPGRSSPHGEQALGIGGLIDRAPAGGDRAFGTSGRPLLCRLQSSSVRRQPSRTVITRSLLFDLVPDSAGTDQVPCTPENGPNCGSGRSGGGPRGLRSRSLVISEVARAIRPFSCCLGGTCLQSLQVRPLALAVSFLSVQHGAFPASALPTAQVSGRNASGAACP
jgi:hypothetical protein